MKNEMQLLKDATPAQLTDLKIALLMCAKNYLGIANLPNESDLVLLCEFLQNKFPELTAQDITKALQMYAAAQLAVDAKPYGLLSAVFLTDVLAEYRQHKYQWKVWQERKQSETLQLNAHEVSAEEKNKRLYEFIAEWIANGNAMPDCYAWNEVYAHLEAAQLIQLSKEDKADYYANTKHELIESVQYLKQVPDKRAEVNELLSILNDTYSLQSLCRKKLVQLYLTNNVQPKLKTN